MLTTPMAFISRASACWRVSVAISMRCSILRNKRWHCMAGMFEQIAPIGFEWPFIHPNQSGLQRFRDGCGRFGGYYEIAAADVEFSIQHRV
jgi:hypothetical protein